MDTAEIAILEKTSQEALRSLLKSDESLGGEPDFIVRGPSNISDEPLEGESWDDRRGLGLQLLDLLESQHSWFEARLLHSRNILA